MYDSPPELIETLQATSDVLESLLRVGSPERESLRADGWSVVEIVCHLRDAEEFALARMRALRDQPNAQISGFDQEEWAREREYANSDVENALAKFKQLRAQHLAELRALTPQEWERAGEHATRGRVTIANHTLHIVWHDAIHLAQIARQLDSRG